MRTGKSGCVGVVVLTALLVSFGATARTVKGVEFPETATVSGQTLKLTGVGLRKKLFFNVYLAGLYVAEPTQPVLGEQAKQARLVMLRDLEPKQVGDAIREGFEKNSSAEMPALKARLDKLIASLTAVKKGEELVIAYTPEGNGKTTVSGRGRTLVELEGKDFGTALFKVWLGAEPVDGDLKKDMLGAAK